MRKQQFSSSLDNGSTGIPRPRGQIESHENPPFSGETIRGASRLANEMTRRLLDEFIEDEPSPEEINDYSEGDFDDANTLLPRIVDTIEVVVRERISDDIVKSWSSNQVLERIDRATDEVMQKLHSTMSGLPKYLGEEREVTLFRLFFDSSRPYLGDLLKKKVRYMIQDIIVEARGSRVTTLTDIDVKEPTVEVIERVISGQITVDSIVGDLPPSTLLPPASSASNGAMSLKDMASLINDAQPEINGRQSAMFQSDTSELDESWGEEESSSQVSSIPPDTSSIDDMWGDDVATKENTLTPHDIIQVGEVRQQDSLAPVVSLNEEEETEKISAEEQLDRISNFYGKKVEWYRSWVAAAALALIAGGAAKLMMHDSSGGSASRPVATVALDSFKFDKPHLAASVARTTVGATKKSPKVKSHNTELVSDKTKTAIDGVGSSAAREALRKMLVEGKVSFGNKRNTIDQLLLPFYKVANASQKARLDELAAKFNRGLYASAVRRFKSMSEHDRRKLSYNGDPTNVDAHVYRALKNSKYGDPGKWGSMYKGKSYEVVFHDDMLYYEQFERDMAGMSKCPRVFQAPKVGHEAQIYDSQNRRFNRVIEDSAKIIFGDDFSSFGQMNIPSGNGSMDTDEEIPVHWDLEGYDD